MLTTSGDEELLGQVLELNDSMQHTLSKHGTIASGSPLPPEVIEVPPGAVGKHESSFQPAEDDAPNATSSLSSSVLPEQNGQTDEEGDGEDEFAILTRRHLKNHVAPHKPSDINGEHLTISKTSHDVASSESLVSPVKSNALVPLSALDGLQTKDQDILDLLSLTITTSSTEQTSVINSAPHGHFPSASSASTFSSEAYPGNPGVAFNNYVAPWALHQSQLLPPLSSYTQPQFESQQDTHRQLTQQPQQQFSQNVNQHRVQPHPRAQPQFPQYSTEYPPPWASTPGYFSNRNPVLQPAALIFFDLRNMSLLMEKH